MHKEYTEKELEVIIGLEIHVQLKTKSKLFCGCSVGDENALPNEHICPVCFGMVGTLPLLNKKAFRLAVHAATALRCGIAQHCKWDRKQYFYPDLPKGYQISQYDEPLATNGMLEFFIDEKTTKKIRINRVHLEEDAAKLIHTDDVTLVDFNRSSVPLIEIVTEPDFRSASDAKMAVKELQRIIRYLGVSDADMEKGHLRCDASVSLRPIEDEKLYPRTEIKNLNSFHMIERAIQYEVARQKNEWMKGTPPVHYQTVLWNDTKKRTEFMREKEQEADYRYFPEPDIPEIELTECLQNELLAFAEEDMQLPTDSVKEYMHLGIDYSTAQYVAGDAPLMKYMSQILEYTHDDRKFIQELSKWFAEIFLSLIKKNSVTNIHLLPEDFVTIVRAVQKKQITRSVGKELMVEAAYKKMDVISKIDECSRTDEVGGRDIEKIVDEVLKQNISLVEQYRNGKTKVIHALIGKAIKKSGGHIPVEKISQVVRNKLHI